MLSSTILNGFVLRQLQQGPQSLSSIGAHSCTGSLLVLLRSHHVTATLSPSASIIATTNSAFVVLLRFIFLPNVATLSVDALNTSRHCLFCLTTMQRTFSPEIAVEASFGPDRQRLFLPHLVVVPVVLLLHVIAKTTPKTNNKFKGNRTPLIYRFKPIEMI